MLLGVLGVGVMGATIFYAAYNMLSGELEASAARRLEVVKKKPSSALLRISRPMFRPLVMPYSSRLKMEDWKKKNKRRIVSAGLEEELDVDELIAYKIFLGFCVPAFLGIYLAVTG